MTAHSRAGSAGFVSEKGKKFKKNLFGKTACIQPGRRLLECK
jgi:hypothetical protein